MRRIRLEMLNPDMAVYPRLELNVDHLRNMKAAVEAGAALPPIVVCVKSRRIADGFHRYRTYSDLFGECHEVEVIEKEYRGERDLFLDAIRLNAGHGRNLDTADRAHCLRRAMELGIDQRLVASSLSVDPSYLGRLSVALTDGNGGGLVMDAPRRRMPFSPSRRPASPRPGGYRQPVAPQPVVSASPSGPRFFLIDQLLAAVQSGEFDTGDETTSKKLLALMEAIDAIL